MTIIQTNEETLTVVLPYDETDDGEHLTHIVSPPENPHITQGDPRMLAQDVVDTARMLDLTVKALCGYEWIPKRDPEKYPACKTCMDIAGYIMREAGE